MITLEIHVEGDKCWPDLIERGWIEGQFVSIARLPHGMKTGDSSVTVRIELPGNQTVLAQTSLALLKQAVSAFIVAEGLAGEPSYPERCFTLDQVEAAMKHAGTTTQQQSLVLGSLARVIEGQDCSQCGRPLVEGACLNCDLCGDCDLGV